MKIADYSSTSPLDWAKEIDELYLLLGPNSNLMTKIISYSNNPISIDVDSLINSD